LAEYTLFYTFDFVSRQRTIQLDDGSNLSEQRVKGGRQFSPRGKIRVIRPQALIGRMEQPKTRSTPKPRHPTTAKPAARTGKKRSEDQPSFPSQRHNIKYTQPCRRSSRLADIRCLALPCLALLCALIRFDRSEDRSVRHFPSIASHRGSVVSGPPASLLLSVLYLQYELFL